MKALSLIAATTLAIVLQTTLSRFVFRGTMPVDFVLVAVIYVALTSGSVAGLFCGTIAGLAQDALSSGAPPSILGIGSLAKTIVGFVAGVVGTQFIVAQSIPRFVVFFGATALHAAIFVGLYVLLELRQFDAPYATVAAQALGNAVVGIVVFQLVELLPGMVERRRAQRARIRR